MNARTSQAFTVVYSLEALDAERRLPRETRGQVRQRCEALAALAQAEAVPAAPAGCGGLQALVGDVRIVYESRPEARALHVLRLERCELSGTG